VIKIFRLVHKCRDVIPACLGPAHAQPGIIKSTQVTKINATVELTKESDFLLADRTNSRANDTVLRPSVVCLPSVTFVLWLIGASTEKEAKMSLR